LIEKPFVSVVTPTFNEVGNITELYERIVRVLEAEELPFEIIVIDNDSSDGTQALLRTIAKADVRFKVIFNESNYGHIKSPYHALLQASGDVAIFLASDLQDPPELISEYLRWWQQGYKVVLAVKATSDEKFMMKIVRRSYYRLISKVSESNVVTNATGAGLFDSRVISTLSRLQEPMPYFRGLITELGFKTKTVPFHQPLRKSGKTKNNLFTLVDMAILGITTQSKAPMRLISTLGLLIASFSLIVAFGYLILKLSLWQTVDFGITPIIFGVFFFGAIQIFLTGLIGEYLVSIQTRIRNLPHVIERERINF